MKTDKNIYFVLDKARADETPDMVGHGYLMHAVDGRELLVKARLLLHKAEAIEQAEKAGYKLGDERWVTVRPYGPDEKGVPVLIKLRKDGSWSVIGGAGGKLNHLRLTGVRSEEEYAAARKKKQESERKRREMMSETEKLAEEESEEDRLRAVEEYESQLKARDREFREEFTAVTGIDVSGRVKKEKLEAKEAEAREQAAREGLTEDAAVNTFVKDKVEEFVHEEKTEQARRLREAMEAAEDRLADDDRGLDRKVRERIERHTTSARAREIIDALSDEEVERLNLKYQEAREVRKQVNALKREDRATNIGTWDMGAFALSDEEAKKLAVEAHARRFMIQANEGLLTEVDNRPARSMRNNLQAGAFTGLYALAEEQLGGILSRGTVDALGVVAAAEILAQVLREEVGESDEVATRIEKYLMDKSAGIITTNLNRVADLRTSAEKMRELAEGDDPVQTKKQAAGRALQYLNEADQLLGGTAGSLEAVSSLAVALRRGPVDEVRIRVGSKTTAYLRARALGLERKEYSVRKSPDEGYELIIKAGEFRKLVTAAPHADGVVSERIAEIKAGKDNRPGWLPEGFKKTYFDDAGAEQCLVLGPDQETAIRLFNEEKRLYLDATPGIGKTIVYIGCILDQAVKGNVKKALIVTPLSVAPQIMEEIQKFTGLATENLEEQYAAVVEKLTGKRAVVAAGRTRDERRKIYAGTENLITIANKEALDNDRTAIQEAGYDMVVVDEAHQCTQRKGRAESMRSEQLAELLVTVPYLLFGSGTPTPNDLSELYFNLHAIAPDKFPTLKDFMEKYGALHKKATAIPEAAAAAFRRELHDHVYSARYERGYEVRMHKVTPELTHEQKQRQLWFEQQYLSGALNPLVRDALQETDLQRGDPKNNPRVKAVRDQIAAHDAKRGTDSKHLIFMDEYATISAVMPELGFEPNEVAYVARFHVNPKTGERTPMSEVEARYNQDWFNLGRKGFMQKYEGLARAGSAREKRVAAKALAWIGDRREAKAAVLSPAGGTGINMGAANAVHLYGISKNHAERVQKMCRAARRNTTHDIDCYEYITEAPVEVAGERRMAEKERVAGLVEEYATSRAEV